jgi:CRP/FNR family transcriptional regulator
MNISTTDIAALWAEHFPALAHSDDAGIQRLIRDAWLLRIPARQRALISGSSCEHYLMLVQGRMRVQVMTEKGREIVLYHVLPGGTCVLTTSCLLSGDSFPAEGITDEDTTVFALTAAQFECTLANSALFRRFVFKTFAQRLTNVISRIEEICSVSIDRRLAEVLVRLHQYDTPVAITHKELAQELGTAREVVSRHLKRFESSGWIKLSRGCIEIKNRDLVVRVSQE